MLAVKGKTIRAATFIERAVGRECIYNSCFMKQLDRARDTIWGRDTRRDIGLDTRMIPQRTPLSIITEKGLRIMR